MKIRDGEQQTLGSDRDSAPNGDSQCAAADASGTGNSPAQAGVVSDYRQPRE